jgi:hypothetical protein
MRDKAFFSFFQHGERIGLRSLRIHRIEKFIYPRVFIGSGTSEKLEQGVKSIAREGVYVVFHVAGYLRRMGAVHA